MTKTLSEKEYRQESTDSRVHSVNDDDRELNMADNGGTRFGTDRRKFQYTACIPEKRSGRERRRGFDRRSPITRRKDYERRVSLNQKRKFPKERKDLFKTSN
jgi:hypothetical protein